MTTSQTRCTCCHRPLPPGSPLFAGDTCSLVCREDAAQIETALLPEDEFPPAQSAQ